MLSWLALALFERHIWKTGCPSACSRAWARQGATFDIELPSICIYLLTVFPAVSITDNELRWKWIALPNRHGRHWKILTPSVCKRLALTHKRALTSGEPLNRTMHAPRSCKMPWITSLYMHDGNLSWRVIKALPSRGTLLRCELTKTSIKSNTLT